LFKYLVEWTIFAEICLIAGDENIHEGLLLEKEGKLLDHPDAKNKRKRIDLGKFSSLKTRTALL
jgi:hypothetical protein